MHSNIREKIDAVNLQTPPPENEPERQYYFMAKCREILAVEQKRSGREFTACVTTFGCQMNARDSEKIAGILEEIGYRVTEEEDADFVLYNTCTVRENANLKVYGRLGYLKKRKEKRPQMITALCGCMMQEPEVVAKIQKSYRNVDIIFGTHNIFKLAELIAMRLMDDREKPSMIVDVWEDTTQIVEELPDKRKYPFKGGVNIMFGCNNFCSYCIVPYVRGRERSREPEDILAEVREMAEDGVKEIMLLGQNVNSYGKTLEHPVSFAELLRMVDAVEGIERIRFMTSHPKDLSDELIEAMAQTKHVCPHFHLPLQSGSDRLLEIMNRHYTKEEYLLLVDKIRRSVPGIAITTDIIVGFPGETEEDFQETLDVVRRAEYDSAYTFVYSKRTGTPAAAMENQVPEDVVKERFDRLLHEVQAVAKKKAESHVGKTVEVLVEEQNAHDTAMVTGRTVDNYIVHFPGCEAMIGECVNVKLQECKGFYFIGSAV